MRIAHPRHPPRQMVDLFQRDKSVISRHIKNVFEEGELVRDSVVAESATTAADGKHWKRKGRPTCWDCLMPSLRSSRNRRSDDEMVAGFGLSKCPNH